MRLRLGLLAAAMLLSLRHLAARELPWPAPLAHWPLDEASGTMAKDAAGGKHDGTLQGSPPASHTGGVIGAGALEFTAPGQEVTGSDADFPAGAAAGSLSLWFCRQEGVADKVLFVYGAPRVGGARGLWLVNDESLCFYFHGTPSDLHAKIPGGIAPERWHHVAGAYDGTTARLYYDGTLVGEKRAPINTVLGARFHIGANLEKDGRDFIGLVDDVAVSDRSLSAEEIRAYYTRHAKNLSPPKRKSLLPELTETHGVQEIIFAVRKIDPDGHWYANFGPDVIRPGRRYYYDGGRLCRLNLKTGTVTALLDDPKGGVRDPQVHYDGQKIVFSYRAGGQPFYHLCEINTDGSGLRQLTDGPADDLEPTYLPDGGIAFVSSRCRRWVPCWFTQVAILYRCDAGGSNVRQLSANVEQENTPWPLPDGRILYQRWEYVDRSQIGYHHLWTMNPDGTGQMVFFGNQHPNTVMLDAKPIPGSRKVVASFSPGHGLNEHSGVITIVDPSAGPDAQAFARPVSRGHYRDPYPLSENLFLVAEGTASWTQKRDGVAILLMDAAGRAERIYELPDADVRAGLKVHEPRPLCGRPREAVIPGRVDPAQPTGRVFLEDVHAGRNMQGVKPGEIRSLLVLEILPKPINIYSGMEPLSYGGTFLLERIVGTVPVEPDGSAYFDLPALRPLFFVALDAGGLAVKHMQSFMTVQPGESVSCVGCHDRRTEAPRSSRYPAALNHSPSVLQPVAGIPDVLDFPRDIQPILDTHCVACHDYTATPRGGPMSGGLILTGDRGPVFSHSFYMLTIAGQIADGRNLRRSNYPPRALGSSASPLMRRLSSGPCKTELSDRERELFRLWLDTGATYAGTYAAMGTGSIGDYHSGSIDRSDLAWPAVKAGRDVLQKRCASCHNGDSRLPESPSDDKGMMPWREGPMNVLASLQSQRNNPVFRYNRNLVYNLSRPDKSLLLLAPLAKEAGGYAICKARAEASAPPAAPLGPGGRGAGGEGVAANVFAGTTDPDYQTLLAGLAEAARKLQEMKCAGMPGFRPNDLYIREMQRYGILPAELSPSAPVDPYATDQGYWKSLWYRPTGGQ